jgi:hypothetical protein
MNNLYKTSISIVKQMLPLYFAGLFFILERLTYNFSNIFKDSKTRLKFSENVVSTVNSCIVIIYAFNVIQDPEAWDNRLLYKSNYAILVNDILIGYSLYDMIICILRYETSGIWFFIHAFNILISTFCIRKFNIFYFYSSVYALYEISTPFLHIRWTLIKMKVTNKSLKNTIDVILIISYFCCRIVWGQLIGNYLCTYDLYNNFILNTESDIIVPSKPLSWFIILNVQILNILSIYWFSLMFRKLLKLIF